jgi:hypothetical protein
MKIPEFFVGAIQGLSIGVLLIMTFFCHSVFFNVLGALIALIILYTLTKSH